MIRAAAASILVAFLPAGATASATPSRCAGIGPARLAYVEGGALLVFDIPSCRSRVLVARGVRPPVRWSADGRYVSYSGGVVTADGRRLFRGLRGVWAPNGHVLATTTRRGGVVAGEPGERPRRLLPDGFGAGGTAFHPGGRLVAVDRPARRELWVVHLTSGGSRLVHRRPAAGQLIPELAGWAGRGALLFRLRVANANSANVDGLPLYAVTIQGGSPRLVTASLLPYKEFATSCGGKLVLAAGGDRFTTRGKRILVAGPPRWRARDVSRDRRLSWIAASCAFDGRDLAVSAGRNWAEPRFGLERRAIWLLAVDGRVRGQITDPPPGRSDELPRWTRDRGVFFIRSGPTRRDASARGRLYLAGPEGLPRGPLADLGPTGNSYGRYGWAEQTDLYVPRVR